MPKPKPQPALTEGHTMYEYEIQRYRSAGLIRHADEARPARQAVRARREPASTCPAARPSPASPGRGEAAAVAHRLAPFPAERLTSPPAQ
ncbi:hypothetical protein [Streptomyces sp. NPDC048392]|uniref:hypothetical protein n=1 Tax=Streptomyces sp. NPDC048392 TaxID=3365543 RepID=UPI00371D53BB